jgi:hypothetical protein
VSTSPIIAGLSIGLPETAEAHAETLRSAAATARADAIAMRREEKLGDYLVKIGTARGLEALAAEFLDLATQLRSIGPRPEGAGASEDDAICPVCGSAELPGSATNERAGDGSGEAVQCSSCGRLFVPSGGRRNF